MNAVRGFFAGVFDFLLFDVLVLLGFIIALNMTVLNPDFITSELKKLDVYPAIMRQAEALLPSQQFIDAKTIDELATELTPWFEEQSDTVIRAVYAYIEEGKSVDVTISLDPVKAALKDKVAEITLNSLPPELQGATQSQIDSYLAQLNAGIDGAIPSTFQLNESVAGPQVMSQLGQIKNIIGYKDVAYRYLIIAAVALVVLIALTLWWQPKRITRSMGITFILVGVVCILGPLLDYLIIQILSQFIGSSGILSGLQTKLPQLAADVTAPVRSYGIGFLLSGIGLVVISFLFRSPLPGTGAPTT
jgi:hypothetical protein